MARNFFLSGKHRALFHCKSSVYLGYTGVKNTIFKLLGSGESITFIYIAFGLQYGLLEASHLLLEESFGEVAVAKTFFILDSSAAQSPIVLNSTHIKYQTCMPLIETLRAFTPSG